MNLSVLHVLLGMPEKQDPDHSVPWSFLKSMLKDEVIPPSRIKSSLGYYESSRVPIHVPQQQLTAYTAPKCTILYHLQGPGGKESSISSDGTITSHL